MEKYGEIPKKFTAKWFEYIWDYYKWHIIVTLAVIAAAAYTWHSIATRTFYDLTVCFAGDNLISEQADERLCDMLSEVIDDINGDGEKNVKIIQNIIGNTDDYEIAMAVEQKFQLELLAGDSYLYIISKERADSLVNNSSAEGLFEETEGWCGRSGENEFFIAVEESEALKNAGVIYNGLYAGVRNFVAGRDDETEQGFRSNALLAAQAILK